MLNEELSNKIRILMTSFDFNKERLFLHGICNVLALKLIKDDVCLEKVREIGVSLGYELKEITILKSSAESIAEVLIMMYEANKNYVDGYTPNGILKTKNPFGVTDVMPNDIYKELPKYETELNELLNMFRMSLRS